MFRCLCKKSVNHYRLQNQMELYELSAPPEENASKGAIHGEKYGTSHSSSSACMMRGGRQQNKVVSTDSRISWRDTSSIIWTGWNSASSFTNLHSNARTEANIQSVSPYGRKFPSVLVNYFWKPSSASVKLYYCIFGFSFYSFYFLFPWILLFFGGVGWGVSFSFVCLLVCLMGGCLGF